MLWLFSSVGCRILRTQVKQMWKKREADSALEHHAAAAAKSLQSCPTLCNPIGSPPGSPSLRFSRQEHWSGLPFPSPMHESEVKVKLLSHLQLFSTPWTAAYQAPPSMGFSRQEYWSGVPLPSPLEHLN